MKDEKQKPVDMSSIPAFSAVGNSVEDFLMYLRLRMWKKLQICFIGTALVSGALLFINGYIGLNGTHRKQPFLTGPPESSGRQLILLTYGRSGSTFTSAIISHDKNVFYVAEPLHHMPKPHDIYAPTVPIETIEAARDIVRAYLSCDSEAIDADVYNTVMLYASNSTIHLGECFKIQRAHPSVFIRCYLNMWKSCKERNVRYVKTIRMKVEWTRWLLEHFPHLRLMYLVRDPRATLYSQADIFGNFDMDSTSDAIEKSQNFCNDVRGDIAAFRQLSSLFPGRLKAFRYEDGALNPEIFARKLYQFAGLEFTNETQRFIQGIASSSSASPRIGKDEYGYIKRNSVVAMNKWRKKAQFKTVEIVDEKCKDLYPLLGYQVVKSKGQLKSNHSLYFRPAKGDIFDME